MPSESPRSASGTPTRVRGAGPASWEMSPTKIAPGPPAFSAAYCIRGSSSDAMAADAAVCVGSGPVVAMGARVGGAGVAFGAAVAAGVGVKEKADAPVGVGWPALPRTGRRCRCRLPCRLRHRCRKGRWSSYPVVIAQPNQTEILFISAGPGFDGYPVCLYLFQVNVPAGVVEPVFNIQRLRLGPLFAAEQKTVSDIDQVVLFPLPCADGVGFTGAQVGGELVTVFRRQDVPAGPGIVESLLQRVIRGLIQRPGPPGLDFQEFFDCSRYRRRLR